MNLPIAYVARFVPEYRRPILKKLNDRLNGRLIVCAGSSHDTSFRNSSNSPPTGYKSIQLKNRWIGGHKALIQSVKPVIECNPVVILAEESPRTISLPWLLNIAKRKRIGTLLWGHFSSNQRKFSERSLPDRYRIAMAKGVNGCVCYTHQIAELIEPYISNEACFVAPNTLDTNKLFRLKRELASERKQAVRSRLGLPENGKTVVFVGRLIKEKRVEVLLDLHKSLSTVGNATLVIIGDGPERAKLEARIQHERLTNIFMLGRISELEDSAPWIYASDVMVCPGYVGLNVNHAFCLGLPIVTCKSPDPRIRYHSPEIAYLQPGMNGMMAEYGDLNALVNATQTVLKKQVDFSLHAYEYAQSHLQLDRMIDGLVQAIEYAELYAKKKSLQLLL